MDGVVLGKLPSGLGDPPRTLPEKLPELADPSRVHTEQEDLGVLRDVDDEAVLVVQDGKPGRLLDVVPEEVKRDRRNLADRERQRSVLVIVRCPQRKSFHREVPKGPVRLQARGVAAQHAPCRDGDPILEVRGNHRDKRDTNLGNYWSLGGSFV